MNFEERVALLDLITGLDKQLNKKK
jgi:hypothetical protein